MLVDVHHYREIGAAVSHIDDVVMADAESSANFFEHGDLAPAGSGANDARNFAGGFIVTKARAENPLRRNDSFERRLNDFLRRSGDNVEMNLVAFGKIFERARKQGDVVLEADALAGFDQMFATHAAKLWIVKNKVAELSALLDEVHLRQADDFVVEGLEPDELTQDDA